MVSKATDPASRLGASSSASSASVASARTVDALEERPPSLVTESLASNARASPHASSWNVAAKGSKCPSKLWRSNHASSMQMSARSAQLARGEPEASAPKSNDRSNGTSPSLRVSSVSDAEAS